MMNRKRNVLSACIFTCIAVAMFLCLFAFSAAAETYGDLSYEIIMGKSVRITGCAGSASYVVIPETIEDLPVGSIAERAFVNHTELRSVTIPGTVKWLYRATFEGCTNLSDVVIQNGVEYLQDGAFGRCSALVSINIPESVKQLSAQTFNGCSGLYSIFVDENNAKFSSDEQGFLYDKEKTILVCLPDAIVGSVTIPESVTEIREFAAAECASVSQIHFPESLEKIQPFAFFACTNLRTVQLPKSVTFVGSSAFAACYSLQTISVDSENTKFSADTYGVLYDKDKTALCAAPGAIRSYTIPDGVQKIGSYAFSYCTKLSEIKIPDSVTAIHTYAFNGCSKLKSVSTKAGVASHAFNGCSELVSADVGGAVGVQAFRDCKNLVSVQAAGSIGSYAFYGCIALEDASMADGAQIIDTCAFAGCEALSTVTIPTSLQKVNERAFFGCSALSNIYYEGYLHEFQQIAVQQSNEPFNSATVYPRPLGDNALSDVLLKQNGKEVTSLTRYGLVEVSFTANASEAVAVVAVYDENGCLLDASLIPVNGMTVADYTFKNRLYNVFSVKVFLMSDFLRMRSYGDTTIFKTA